MRVLGVSRKCSPPDLDLFMHTDGENISKRRWEHLFSSCHDEGSTHLMISRKQTLLISGLMSQSNTASVPAPRGVVYFN